MVGNMNNIKVSVVVPVFNNAEYIGTALDSIISQDFDAFEIIVVDDGSSDNSLELITDKLKGIDIPNEKNIGISLTYIYGIGLTTAKAILAEANVEETKRVKDLTDDELGRIRSEVAKYRVEGDLRREVTLNIKRLMEIGCYRGIRHRRGLPVRGQNTRNNARTRKGPARTIAGKKK